MILMLLGRFKRQDVFSTFCFNSINFDFFYLYPFILFLIFNTAFSTSKSYLIVGMLVQDILLIKV